MCDVYHVMGIVTKCGLTVALGCLLVHLPEVFLNPIDPDDERVKLV